jgi:hypothetical protein
MAEYVDIGATSTGHRLGFNPQTGAFAIDNIPVVGDVGVFLPLAGGTMSGNINMGGERLTSLGAANAAGEAVEYAQWAAALLALTPNTIVAASLPTADPHVVGEFWNNLGIATISAG